MSGFKIVHPIPARHMRRAAQLHFAAFEGKIGNLLGCDGRGEEFFADVIDPKFGIGAMSKDGAEFFGVAGFKTSEGSLIGGSFSQLQSHYGFLGALWRAPVLAILERPVEAQRLLMDGIAVDPARRSEGIGSALLDAVCQHAAQLGMTELRLDVIDSNPRARALYERKGFVCGEKQELGPFRHVFGFNSAITMVRAIEPQSR